MGPIFALFLASLLRANKASALLCSLFTNTWLSFILLVFAVKLGSFLLGISWIEVQQSWLSIYKQGFSAILKFSFLDILLPVMIGYILISFFLSVLAYIISLAFLKNRNKQIKS